MVEDEVRWRRSKDVFMNRVLLQHGIWFAFGAARLVEFRLVSVEMKWRHEMLRRQRVLSDVRD